jgi:hypothetical protein
MCSTKELQPSLKVIIASILSIGLVITILLGGNMRSVTKEAIVGNERFFWEYGSPGIQSCELEADSQNNHTLIVKLGIHKLDMGHSVEFNLTPGETRIINLIDECSSCSRYSIDVITVGFFYEGYTAGAQNVSITINALTASLEYLSSKLWIPLIPLIFSLMITGPLAIILLVITRTIDHFYQGTKIIKYISFRRISSGFLIIILVTPLIYWYQMIIFTQSLIPLTLSTGITGLIILFTGFSKEDSHFKDL